MCYFWSRVFEWGRRQEEGADEIHALQHRVANKPKASRVVNLQNRVAHKPEASRVANLKHRVAKRILPHTCGIISARKKISRQKRRKKSSTSTTPAGTGGETSPKACADQHHTRQKKPLTLHPRAKARPKANAAPPAEAGIALRLRGPPHAERNLLPELPVR